MNTHNSFRIGILAILFAVVLPLGCQQGGPADLVGASDTGLSPSLQRASTLGETRGKTLDDELQTLTDESDPEIHEGHHFETKTVTRMVTPSSGGSLRLMHSKLVLFPGSVMQPVAVSWSITDDEPHGLKGALPRIYQFSPEGLVFNTPGKAFISFKDAGLGKRNPHSYRFYYFNESTGKWERQETHVNIFLKQFVVTMHHFSRYAFGR